MHSGPGFLRKRLKPRGWGRRQGMSWLGCQDRRGAHLLPGLSGMKAVFMGSRKQQAPEAGYLHSEGVCHHHAQDGVSHD